MTYDDDRDEQNTPSTISLADTITSHTRWARSVISPWAQRTFDRTRRPGSAGISASHTLDRVQRVQHKANEAKAWRPDVGSVSPASLQQFAGTIIRRHQSFQAKATAHISHPQSGQDDSSDLPLAHPGGIRIATEGDDSQSPVSPAGPSSPSMPAQPSQPSGSPSQPAQMPSSQPSESSDIPPLPANHPLNTGDVPTKRVQRNPSSPPTPPQSSTPQAAAQQTSKRRRIYSRVEEITPGGAMTDTSTTDRDRDDGESVQRSVPKETHDASDTTTVQLTPDDTEPVAPAPPEALPDEGTQASSEAPATEKPADDMPAPDDIQRAVESSESAAAQPDDGETAEELAASLDDTSTVDRDGGGDRDRNDGGSTVQRSVPQETPAASAQPTSTDSDASSPRRPDATSSTPSRDSTNVQRTADRTKRVLPPLSESRSDEEASPSEEPQASEQPTDDVGDSAVSRDIQRDAESSEQEMQPAEPQAVHDEHSEDSPQQPSVSESTRETHSPVDSNDVTVQRREQESDFAETEPAAPSPQTEAERDSSPESAAPATDDSDTPEAVDNTATTDSPADAAQQSTVQRTPEDAPTTSPPAERQEGATDATAANSAEMSTGTLEQSDVQASGTDEAAEQEVPEQITQQSTDDSSQIQRSPEHDTGAEPPISADADQPADEPGVDERPSQPERSAAQEALPSSKPDASTEIEPSDDEPSRIQRHNQDDAKSLTDAESTPADREPAAPGESDSEVQSSPEPRDIIGSDDVPASVQRKPSQTGEQADTETTQVVAETPEPSEELIAPVEAETQTSDEPAPIQHDADQAIQQVESTKDGPSSAEPSRKTTVQRSPERDASDDTIVQRRSDTPDVPAQHVTEQSTEAESQPDDGTPPITSDDTTSVEPEAQRSASDDRTFSKDIAQPSDDAPAPPQTTALRQEEGQTGPVSHTPESTQQSAAVQRTEDDSTAGQTGDVAETQEPTTEPEAPSKPASPLQQEELQRDAPASGDVKPGPQQAESEEQPEGTSARDRQPTEPQPDAHVQRDADDGSGSTATDSDMRPTQELRPQSPSEPAPPSEETTPRAHIQRQPDDARSPEASDAMPLPKPHTVKPPEPIQGDAPTDSTIQRKSSEDASTVRSVPASDPETHTKSRSAPAETPPASPELDSRQRRTLQREAPDSADVHVVDEAPDTQHAIRKAPAPDHAPASEPPSGGLDQTIVSRAESHSRLPLAMRHTIRRKPARPSDNLGISRPTQTFRRVRTQIQARSPRTDETRERNDQRTQEVQRQPLDDRTHTPTPETRRATEMQSDASGDTLARSEMQPAPQVSPPVFTPSARTSDSRVIQRTPLEFVQRVSPSAGSEARQEPAQETTSESDPEERDDESEINLDRLARDVYPLIKRMIAVERERRPGR